MSAAGPPPSEDPTFDPEGISEEERLRAQAAYEAELSRVSAIDVIAQAAVSLLNIGAQRLAPVPAEGGGGEDATGGAGSAPPQQDLAQARDAIDAATALLEILERTIPQEMRPLRDALARLQMAYAREVQVAGAPPAGPTTADEPGPDQGEQSGDGGAGQTGPEQQRGPGPAESSGRLWVPGR